MPGVKQEGPVELFCSYSHKDELLQRQFLSHTAILRRKKWVEVWMDQRIGAGDDYNREIALQLETAQIIVLLVSSDFIDAMDAYIKRFEKGSG